MAKATQKGKVVIRTVKPKDKQSNLIISNTSGEVNSTNINRSKGQTTKKKILIKKRTTKKNT